MGFQSSTVSSTIAAHASKKFISDLKFTSGKIIKQPGPCKSRGANEGTNNCNKNGETETHTSKIDNKNHETEWTSQTYPPGDNSWPQKFMSFPDQTHLLCLLGEFGAPTPGLLCRIFPNFWGVFCRCWCEMLWIEIHLVQRFIHDTMTSVVVATSSVPLSAISCSESMRIFRRNNTFKATAWKQSAPFKCIVLKWVKYTHIESQCVLGTY